MERSGYTVSKYAIDDSSNELTLTIVNRVIRRIRRQGRTPTLETVCQEIEEFKSMPTLADKVTTAMVRQALSASK
jgi:hypothetical protein